MSANDVTSTGNRVIINNALNLDGAKEIVKAFGKNVSPEELKAAIDIFGRRGLALAPEAREYTGELVDHLQGLLRMKDQMNAQVVQYAPRFAVEEAARLKVGVVTKTFGGTEIPEAVKKVVNAALAAGARTYDVRHVLDPEWNHCLLYTSPSPRD